MNANTWMWSLVWALVTVGLLGLPWVPAWAEWRRPRDVAPLPPPAPAVAPSLPQVVHVPGGAFGELQARHLLLGDGLWPVAPDLPPLTLWQPPPGARPWGQHGWHFGRHLDIDAGQRVPCTLVVRGRLQIHGPTLVEGDIKTRDELRLGPGTQVRGNLFSEGDIRLEEGCSVTGLVMAEGTLHLAPGVVIGSAQMPTSVCADRIRVHGPVRAHGSLHARLGGEVLSDAAPRDTAFFHPSKDNA